MTNLSNISYDDYLEVEDTLMHFGVKGMKWGVKQAPQKGAASSANKQKYETTKNRARERRDNYGYKTMSDARKTEYSNLKGLAGNMAASTGLVVSGNAAGKRGLTGAKGAALVGANGNMLRSSYKTYQKQGLSKGESMGMAIIMGPVGNIALAELHARRGNNAVKNFERHKQS